jgi:hypothetical protein
MLGVALLRTGEISRFGLVAAVEAETSRAERCHNCSNTWERASAKSLDPFDVWRLPFASVRHQLAATCAPQWRASVDDEVCERSDDGVAPQWGTVSQALAVAAAATVGGAVQ